MSLPTTARLGIAVAACVACSTVATGCASGDSGTSTLTVFAASSLTAVFTEISEGFMAENPDVNVIVNFAASSELAAQIAEGAPADVFASADLATMQTLVADGHTDGSPVVFAENEAAIIVEPGNPQNITGVADLARDDLVVVQCAPEVPCGRYAESIYANAGVTVTPASFEENAKAVVTKVMLGEADAGIVYATDVVAAGDGADGVAIPPDIDVVAEYPIATVAGRPSASAADAFVAFVLGEQGRRVLDEAGFGTP